MIVVNFSTKQYLNGQQRLARSIYASNANTFMVSDYSVIDSPSHKESPYEFKVHAIRKALEKDDVVLWADSSMYCVGDLSHIENIIKEDGYFFEEAGHYAGSWTNKHTRDYFKVTDIEMFKGHGGIAMFSAGLLGLNKKSEVAMEFLNQWEASAKAGCFKGDWSDHRHDMTCASIIATRLGMKYQSGGSHMAYVGPGYATPHENIVFLCQGIL